MELDLIWGLSLVFAVIAFVYGSVGLGGGSAYVAVMALAGIDHRIIPMIALGLNLVVAGGGFAHFARGGYFRSSCFIPLAMASVPAAFFAAQINIDLGLFQILLGGLLLLAGIRMCAARWLPSHEGQERKAPLWLLVMMGLSLGAVAGLTGIGGGIYLAPLLLMTRLASPKQAASLASGFVLVNSASGLVGHLVSGESMPWMIFLPFAAVVLVAGQLGAVCGAMKFKPSSVQATFGLLVVLVSIRLFVR